MKHSIKIKYSTISTFIILLHSLFSNCSSLQLTEHNGFWEWLKGKPGSRNAGDATDDLRGGKIIGDRHPFYLWFRTPEIIFNPQGGTSYPDMIVINIQDDKFYNTIELPNIKDENLKTRILNSRKLIFFGRDAGLIEHIVPYREIISGDPKNWVDFCVYSPVTIIFLLPERLIGYPIHDIIKTLMLPVAGVYYTVQAFDKEDEEE